MGATTGVDTPGGNVTDGMTYTAVVPYYGSKRTLAPKIIDALGPHRCYWSLFAGSLAVELAKPVCPMETVNDLHGDVINLARVIRDEDLSGRLHWKLRRTLSAEPLFRESLAILGEGPPPPISQPPCPTRAYHYLVNSWLGLSGIAGTARTGSSIATRFSSKGGAPGKRFAGVADSLPWWHERLRTMFILQECGIGLAERIEDRDGTVIYADPPYLVKNAKYKHDFTPADHERLATALGRFRLTRVVVSYYDHPDLESLYPGWSKLEVGTTNGLVNAGKRLARVDGEEPTQAPEVLLVNRAVPVAVGLWG